ncbi:MAG: hypothetical protein KJP25_03455 [Gammaproteobacteria bacterium]|nr:hypothetical protein [Gammaproteobacteria bacterium]MBT8150629.1 hypothetical protein [Gammaproteobacteria bacterium]NND39343.1 hypothetical protein [Pseudomonadales bacterium]NNM12055.1 hypothetical protein [Pseudomonadales bacterium]
MEIIQIPEDVMRTQSLPDVVPDAKSADHPASASAAHEPLLNRFCKKHGGWFVRHGDTELIGPFTDKADAQMALLYFSARLFWPNDKQLREFARHGK